MRRKMMAAVLTMAMVTAMVSGCGSSTDTANAGNSTNEAASAEATETAKTMHRILQTEPCTKLESYSM